MMKKNSPAAHQNGGVQGADKYEKPGAGQLRKYRRPRNCGNPMILGNLGNPKIFQSRCHAEMYVRARDGEFDSIQRRTPYGSYFNRVKKSHQSDSFANVPTWHGGTSP